MSKRNKNRSAREIVAAKRNELAKAEARAAMKDAQSLPQIAVLTEALADTKTEKLVAKRKFSGPQSFEKRIAKHQAWVAEIVASCDLALSNVEAFEARETYLKDSVTDLITSYLAGDLSKDELEEQAESTVDNMPSLDTNEDLAAIAHAATETRKELTTKVVKENEEEIEA